ncbi:hypothetical protein GCM10022252_20020 [Streptosporangium oxazolinicum]|uniref:Uncharacterized protein n=1 Tax=Streptosporangium oxazolinicum TaxID=909287 RepID=A0ABP8ANX3_9ACTN
MGILGVEGDPGRDHVFVDVAIYVFLSQDMHSCGGVRENFEITCGVKCICWAVTSGGL